MDITQSQEIRLKMQGEDQVLKLESRLLGHMQYIRELLNTIESLLIALELEADYPGERTREEISNSKAMLKEAVDLGYR